VEVSLSMNSFWVIPFANFILIAEWSVAYTSAPGRKLLGIFNSTPVLLLASHFGNLLA